MKTWLCWLLLIAALPVHALEPFAAQYRLLVDGQPRATAQFRLALEDQRYELRTRVQPNGEPGAPAREILESSQGSWSASEVRPERYLYSVRNDQQTQTLALGFDWANQRLILQSGDRQETYRLDEQAQDRLSYLLKAMILAAGNRKKISFPRLAVEGRETFTLERVRRQFLSTPAGRFLALEIRVQSDHSPERRLWLAVEKGYLPLAIEQKRPEGLVRMELTAIETQ